MEILNVINDLLFSEVASRDVSSSKVKNFIVIDFFLSSICKSDSRLMILDKDETILKFKRVKPRS